MSSCCCADAAHAFRAPSLHGNRGLPSVQCGWYRRWSTSKPAAPRTALHSCARVVSGPTSRDGPSQRTRGAPRGGNEPSRSRTMSNGDARMARGATRSMATATRSSSTWPKKCTVRWSVSGRAQRTSTTRSQSSRCSRCAPSSPGAAMGTARKHLTQRVWRWRLPSDSGWPAAAWRRATCTGCHLRWSASPRSRSPCTTCRPA